MTSETQDALSCAAEDIRRACLATLPAGALQDPEEAYQALVDLRVMAERLPQLTWQISARLEAHQKAGRIAHDKGGSAQQSVTSTGAYLYAAGEVAGQMGTWLAKAQNEAAHLKAAGRGNVS